MALVQLEVSPSSFFEDLWVDFHETWRQCWCKLRTYNPSRRLTWRHTNVSERISRVIQYVFIGAKNVLNKKVLEKSLCPVYSSR